MRDLDEPGILIIIYAIVSSSWGGFWDWCEHSDPELSGDCEQVSWSCYIAVPVTGGIRIHVLVSAK